MLPFQHELNYAGLSDAGRVRSQNEDRWLADPELGLFIVADGMGGEAAGALAAEIVVETLPRLLRHHLSDLTSVADPQSTTQLREMLTELSSHLRAESQGQLGLDGMGSTVVLALFRGQHVLIGHLGDSRAYLLREEQLEQLTQDHSLIQLLLEHGEITTEEAVHHPARGQLTRNVGMEGDAIPVVRLVDLRANDRLLLCSDGLTGMLSDEQLVALLNPRSAPEVVCRNLVSTANELGGKDNITAVVIDVMC